MNFLRQYFFPVLVAVLVVIPAQGQAQFLTGYRSADEPEHTRLSSNVSDSVTPPRLTGYGSESVPASRPAPEAEPPRPDDPGSSRDEPVDLSADNLQHNDKTGIITASGNVELVQGDRILRADTISYNLNTDTVIARGNIALTEPNGDVHFADEVRLTNEMSDGFIRGLQSYLAEGGQFTAEEGERINGKRITMRNAAYTPCECDTDSDGDPAWQIKADEVTVDEEEHKIRYRNARFEIFGVPVAWTPFLSHPDGKVERKSGFLTPEVGFDSQLGMTATQSYYWDIAPDKDATFGTMLMTREAPVALAQYRQRFAQASLYLDGSATYSGRSDRIAGEEVNTDKEFRGHLFGKSLWSIDEKWRAGLNLEVTTDDQYLRQYDFSSKDVLENELYAERFSGRNYAIGQILAFQDVRVEEERTDQPNILPEIEMHFMGEPNKTFGGRWQVQTSALNLHREGGQDMTRLTGKAGWQRRYVTDFGLVNTLDLSVRGDAYHANDRDVTMAGNDPDADGFDTRILPQAHMVSSYPFVKPMENMQAVIEPVGALTVAPNIDDIDDNIPNEDSQDVQIDASNIFEPNRFPGKDRLEDRSRVTYGVRSGLYGYQGSYGNIFIGQSYRLHKGDNPFPYGSGLERRESDWVGQVAGMYDNRYGLNYRFQLKGSDFTSRRHEVDGYADFGRLDLSSRYLFASSLGGTDIDESREQIYGAASYDVTDNWRVRGSVLEDMGANPGLREATFGLDYFGCCLSFSATVQRNITSDVSGDSGTDIKFRIGLKGLGEFQTAPSGPVSASNRN